MKDKREKEDAEMTQRGKEEGSSRLCLEGYGEVCGEVKWVGV